MINMKEAIELIVFNPSIVQGRFVQSIISLTS